MIIDKLSLVTMRRLPEGDYIKVASVEVSHQHRKLIGFRAAVGQINHLDEKPERTHFNNSLHTN